MKKILTVSLVAMMAASAARADIASVDYVTKNYTTTGNMEAAIATAKGEAITAAAADAAKYIDATELQASQEAQDTALKKYADDAAAAAKTDATYNDTEVRGLIQANTDKLSTVEATANAAQTETQVATAINNKVATLAKADAAVDKQFVTAVSETNGIISVSRAALKAADIPTIEQDQVNGLAGALNAKEATSNKLKSTDTTTQVTDANKDTLFPTMGRMTDYVDAQITVYDNGLGDTKDQVAANAGQITALQTQLGEVEATADAAQTAEEVATAINNKVATLAKTDNAVDKQFVTAVSEANGVISVSRAALKATDIPTIEQSQVSGLGTALNNKQAKAGANPYQIVKEDGTWATLTYGLPDKCKGDGVVCSLISTNGTVGWEVVAK